jgi:hypothetical protein
VPKASGFGPTILSRCSGSSDQRGARGARLGSIASSCIATLKNKEQPPPIHKMRDVEGVRDSGPQYRQRSSRVIRSERDTWCAIRLYRLFAHRYFEEQGSASSQLRDTKRRKRPLRISAGSRPMVTRGNRRSCAKGPKEPSLAAEGIAAISRCQSDSVSTLVPARSKWRWEDVVETSPHSLIVRYGGSGRQSARDGPVCWFFSKKPCRALD